MKLLSLAPLSILLLGFAHAQDPALHAGAAKVDISPLELPVLRNGGFLQAIDKRIADPLHARSLVLH